MSSACFVPMKPSKTIIAEKTMEMSCTLADKFPDGAELDEVKGQGLFCIKYIYINEMRGQEEIL